MFDINGWELVIIVVVALLVIGPERLPEYVARLRQGLSKTSASLGEGMASLFLGKKAIDDDLLDATAMRITSDGAVVATGVNDIVASHDPTSHAEMQALRAASRRLAR